MRFIHWLAVIFVIIGSLNWGLIGIANFNLIAQLVSDEIARIIYGVVGLSAIYLLVNLRQMG